jgi:hypothetical protein
MKLKYGNNILIKLNNYSKSTKNGFLRLNKRVNVINGKIKRATKSTPLHTAKQKYRNAVKRATDNSIKTHGLENHHLIDKYNYNVDHVLPTMIGFKYNIPPELIGDIRNLKVIKKVDNIKKRMKLLINDINLELFKEYEGVLNEGY